MNSKQYHRSLNFMAGQGNSMLKENKTNLFKLELQRMFGEDEKDFILTVHEAGNKQ